MPAIRSSADLRNGYNDISAFCHTYNEPIFITDFGLSDFYRIYDVMKSSSEFKKVIITVPCSYHSATEDVDSFFDINSEESIKAFMPYRKSAEAVSK